MELKDNSLTLGTLIVMGSTVCSPKDTLRPQPLLPVIGNFFGNWVIVDVMKSR